MKNFILSLTIIFCITFTINAQQPAEAIPSPDKIQKEENQQANTRSTLFTKRCTDTIGYPQGKATGYRGIFLNTTGSAEGLAQYYEIPQNVKIYGFEFFANQDNSNPPGSIKLTCNLYKAGGSLLPTGMPIRSVEVPVLKKSGSNLNNFRYEAIFDQPITVDYPVILSVETASSLNVALYTNDFDQGDGDGEYLTSGQFSGNWLSGTSFTVNGNPFDADVILQPFVEFDAVSDFTLSKHCIEAGDTVEITNHSSAIYDSRFFNKTAFNHPNHSGEESFQWSFTQGIPGFVGYDTSFIVQTKTGHRVQMTATIDKWEDGQCVAVIRDSVDQEPIADFSKTSFSGSIHFWNNSVGLGSSNWYFEDGTFTNQRDPSYYFTTTGDQEVTLIVTNGCSSDTMTKTIFVYEVGIDNPAWSEGMMPHPNPATDQLKISLPENQEFESIELYDISGKLVASQGIGDFNNISALNISQLATGTYLLKVNHQNGETANFKVVKQ